MPDANQPFFGDVEPIRYAGPDTAEPLAFRWYDPERRVAGRRMEDHLRFAVCYWHSFDSPGSDVFGDGTWPRPWLAEGGAPLERAAWKMRAAFEFLEKLGVPFFCFHDRDMAPEGGSFGESCANLDRMVEAAAEHMERTGVRLLWGTARLFGHPRYAAGAATNPDPEVFAYAAGQVKHCLEATKRLGGENYVLWGGREGYETLLNTDLRREAEQYARFLHLVVEHKHRLGFDGTILVEPKPHEPTKHQHDRDVAAVHAFCERYDLMGEVKVNVEVNHATLAGLSFHHELAYAIANDLFGSVDANRGDPQLGWDTDQFPIDVTEWALALYEILRAGGFSTGGLNFDAKLRRGSVSRDDLFHAHVGAMDAIARGLLAAEQLLEDGDLRRFVDDRYAGWRDDLGRRILDGELTLADLHREAAELDPRPSSGRQEMLENLVARAVDRSGRT